MTATLRLAIDEKDIFGEPSIDEIDNAISLNTKWVRKRAGDVSWKPATARPGVLKTVRVEAGVVFTLIQVWRGDHQALLRDNRGEKIVVGTRALRKEWRRVREAA